MENEHRVEELERELAHARDMLRALQRQEVDAVVAEGSVSIIRLRETEAELHQTRREVEDRTRALQDANRELESFAYAVAHELRAPLRHVRGFVELLRRELGDGLPQKAAGYADLMVDATREMGQLIEDLLSMSRISGGEMREDAVDLDRLAAEVRVDCAAVAGTREIEWRVAPLPRVRGDKTMLRQVLVNTFENAVKYTRRAPHAVIEVGSAAPAEGYVTVFVKDNGVGFDPQYAHRLFNVFQRLHSSQDFEGTGIGLATVRRIVARHGGRVWAEGAPGQGATFYFTLKAAPSADR